MLWHMTQTRSLDDTWTLGYFTSKRALLRYCKAQIGTDCPTICDHPCHVTAIGRRCDSDGACSIDHAGTIVFEGTWTDGNTHRVMRAVPTFKT